MNMWHIHRILLLTALLVITLPSILASPMTNSQRIAKINALVKSDRSPISLDTGSFYDILEAPGERDFSVIVVFTALSAQFSCVPCQALKPEFELLAASAANQNQVYFAVLDFENGRDIFQKRQMNSAPFIYHFKPLSGPRGDAAATPEQYNVQKASVDAEALAEWVNQVTGSNFTIQRPVDYSKIAMYGVATLVVLAAIRSIHGHLGNFYTTRKFWTMISLAIIVMCISGEMWNRIRSPPYTGADKGRPVLFAGETSFQFVIESQIVAFLYAFFSISFVLLVSAPKKIKNLDHQRYMTYGLVLCVLLAYSLLLMVFRFKHQGYPFRLFF